jgi:hypothetical protein
MDFKNLIFSALLVLIALGSPAQAGNDYRVVPPNMVGLLLTPSGYDGKIYTPGQVNIQTESWSGYGNQLVLLQRSGYYIKEQFLKTTDGDHADHRCVIGPNRELIDLDVRLLFAMPDPSNEQGKQAILRMGLLGNPMPFEKKGLVGGDRVLFLSAESIYQEQVRNQVRGKIRDICQSYDSVDSIFEAMKKNGSGEGFSDTIRQTVATVLSENDSPLLLVAAVVSNIKEDPLIVQAMVAQKAAEELVLAMELIDRFIKEDPTGQRAQIFKLMTVRDIITGNDRTNTMFLTDISGLGVLPIPAK